MESDGPKNSGKYERRIMFQLTTGELNEYVKQSGFLKNSLEKVIRLVDILSVLQANSVTRDAFVLKGGTALNVFILDFPRLSVDVDLDYVRFSSKAQMQSDRNEIIPEILKIFLPEYRVQITKEAHALTQLSFFYRTMSGSSDMLKIEMNFLRRVPLLPPKLRNFNRFGYVLDILCLDDVELLAGKIIALLSRYAPRDLFDIYQMIASFLSLDPRLLRSLLLFNGMTARTSVFDLFELKLESITQRDIKNILRPLLHAVSYPSREEMLLRVEKFLPPYLSFTDEEEAAIKSFYKTGELDLDTLFPQEDIQKRILRSPSLQWKVQHIKKALSP